MNIYAWIGFGLIMIFALIPLFKKETRTRWAVFQAIGTFIVLLATTVAITVANFNSFISIVIAVIILTLLERKIYTKKGMIGTSIILMILILSAYYNLRENPEYILRFLEKNPQAGSLYVTKNGKDIIKYQIDEQMPLASVVKTVIAIEYAHQVADGILDDDEKVSLTAMEPYYFKGTDGGAHPAWLDEMNKKALIENNTIALHQVAKGMISHSSNANTEYLMDILGLENINKRIEILGLNNHDSIYPFISAVLVSKYTGKDTVEELKAMSNEEYQSAALAIHKDLKTRKSSLKNEIDLPLDIQRIWSDRLPSATAADYQKLMADINHKSKFPPQVEEVIRDIMEWPMERYESNREKFNHFGAKGGSTAFVLNQALYVEDNKGNKMELILFTNDLSLLQSVKIGRNIDSFLIKIIESPDFLEKVGERLNI